MSSESQGLVLRVTALSIGGALGVNARYFLAIAIDRVVDNRFPWATFAINMTGAFVLGLLSTLMAKYGPHHPARLLALVGFLGGYTTFSTFTLESFKLVENGSVGPSLSYMIGSMAIGFVAVAGGITLGRTILPDPPPVSVRLEGANPSGTVGLAEVD